MPTYEYACTSCGRHVEAVQKFTDDPLAECPHCGGPLRKVFGSIGIVLKGSGFYKNDSRSSGGTSAVGSPPSSEGTTEGTKEAPSKEAAAGTGAGPSSTSSADSATTTKSEPAATPKKAASS